MPQQRKIPMRMCAGCAQHKPKKELVRVVRTPEGEVFLDLTGRKSGRGVYVCPDPECLKKARKAHRFERALDCEIPDQVYERMEQELEGAAHE